MRSSLLLIPLVAFLAPIAARGIGRWVRIPVVVFELVLGIVIGPSVLGWAQPNEFIDQLAELGLVLLFFVAGSEIEPASLRGRTGRRAVGTWLISLALGVAAGLTVAGPEVAIVIGIALCSTAVGTILPILRDAGETTTPFGKAVLAVGAVGEFGPLIAISLFLGARDLGASTIVLVLFALLTAGAIILANRIPKGALHDFVETTLHTSAQFAIRVILLIIGVLVALSYVLDLDVLLGAFAAGIVWSLLIRDADEKSRHAVESKIEGVAFGFLVPVFFIYTGVTFDLTTLLETPTLWLGVLVVAVCLLIVRGLPAVLAAPPGATPRDRVSFGLLSATGLPIIVAVTGIAGDEGLFDPWVTPVLVAGGMVSVLLFPLIALTVRGERVKRAAGAIDEEA
ncbi:cation:proton antiporter [Microbacterium telephonicum]|uniref:Transporter (CPA2 family) n=1 Tax=Microbacterium telephonicum TaxID=1714841 RepID=A0A498BXU2_9MICO|nr:cation:proton antiporter [Microbacterium telephonicum]RLK48102.1 transporter (CPA2 family) [Microbacterium telephonicum]